MIFYQNSASIDKGVVSKNIHFGRIDTCIGCICQVVIAACIIIIGASLFGNVPDIASAGPNDIIAALNTNVGFWAALLFGLGLFNAGLLASITVSFINVFIAAAIVLIPNLPLNYISVIAQVVGGILMAPILIFLTLLTSNKELMGEYKNSLLSNIRAWITVAILIGMAFATILNSLIGS